MKILYWIVYAAVALTVCTLLYLSIKGICEEIKHLNHRKKDWNNFENQFRNGSSKPIEPDDPG